MKATRGLCHRERSEMLRFGPLGLPRERNEMPPAKRRRPLPADKRLALNKRLAEIRAEIATLMRERAVVRREEFEEVTRSLAQVQRNAADLAVQFKRIAQLQADVDIIKGALVRARLLG